MLSQIQVECVCVFVHFRLPFSMHNAYTQNFAFGRFFVDLTDQGNSILMYLDASCVRESISFFVSP